jgi:hypothetical protein
VTTPRLPDALEAELTLAHSEVCLCAQVNDSAEVRVGKGCREVRDILREAIAEAMTGRLRRLWQR